MKTYRKIAAFTLTEMLLVLAISAIVAGLAFSIVTLFTRNVQGIQNNYAQSSQQRLFENQLAIDFNRYHSISYDKVKEELQFKTILDSVAYSFDDIYIIRKSDTLLTAQVDRTFFFLGDEKTDGTIDAIKINWDPNKLESFIFVSKRNDAAAFINLYGN